MGLRCLSSRGVVHLDLKPNNVMLSSGLQIKLIDFGEAFHPELFKEAGGRYKPGQTLPYSPPEFQAGVKEGFTSKADVYSLGVLMFEVLYGKVPIERREAWFLAPETSDCFGEPVAMRMLNWVISRCLSREPADRP